MAPGSPAQQKINVQVGDNISANQGRICISFIFILCLYIVGLVIPLCHHIRYMETPAKQHINPPQPGVESDEERMKELLRWFDQ